MFNFYNAGPNPSIIGEVYFDDGHLLGIANIYNTDGEVQFEQGANPGHLPGNQCADPDFIVTEGFLAQPDSPSGTDKNGVDPYEWLGIEFAINRR